MRPSPPEENQRLTPSAPTGVGIFYILFLGILCPKGNGLDVTGAGTVIGPGGTGSLNVTNTAAVQASGDVTNGAGGTINVSDASLFANDIVNNAGGAIVGGGGTFVANIDNSGTIGPGNSAGLMSVIGDVTMQAGSTMEIEIGGTTFDTGLGTIEYDRLQVDSFAGLFGGTFDVDAAAMFDVTFTGGFVGSLGDAFDIAVAEEITGTITESQVTVPVLTGGLA